MILNALYGSNNFANMPTRRTFLRQAALLSTAALATPAFGFHILKRRPKGPIIGHGDFRYRLHREWGQLDPQQYPVKDCHEMVQDRQGRLILLTNEVKNNVLIYDRSGRILGSWGTEYPGAHGLTLHEENGEEFLFITDQIRNEVYKTTLDGQVLMTLGWPEASGLYPNKSRYHPTETAIAPNGDIYIADGYGLQYVLHYDAKGNYLGHFGGMGWIWKELMAGRYPHEIDEGNNDHNPLLLNNAHGIALDTRKPGDPILLVTSRMDNAIKRFSLSGEYLSEISIPGAFVCRPVVQGENVYAAVLRSDRPTRDRTGFVTILDKEDRVVSNPGGTRPRYKKGHLKQVEQAKPYFIHPHDVCVDRDINLYIPQWDSGKVYPVMLERV